MHDDTDETENLNLTETSDATELLDLEVVEADIAAGAKARAWLIKNTDRNWEHWSIFIKGFRSLRNLIFAEVHTTNVQSQDYRDAIGGKLELKKYAAYDTGDDRPLRSDCYALMDRIEDIDAWLLSRPLAERQRWQHPNSIRKNCPKHFLSAGRGHNKPPRIKKPKPVTNAEIERLKALLIQLIHAVLNAKDLAAIKQEAASLLDQVMPATTRADPDDSLDDMPRTDAAAVEDALDLGEGVDDADEPEISVAAREQAKQMIQDAVDAGELVRLPDGGIIESERISAGGPEPDPAWTKNDGSGCWQLMRDDVVFEVFESSIDRWRIRFKEPTAKRWKKLSEHAYRTAREAMFVAEERGGKT